MSKSRDFPGIFRVYMVAKNFNARFWRFSKGIYQHFINNMAEV
jgi:hypothetical protein